MVSYPLGAPAGSPAPRVTGVVTAGGKNHISNSGRNAAPAYDYLYSPEGLEDMADRTRELLARVAAAYVIFNNHPAGQAVANDLELRHILDQDFRPTLPGCLLNPFPQLQTKIS